MDITRRSFTLGAIASATLSACGGGGSSNSNLRLLNASVGNPGALSLQVNSSVINSGVTYGTVGSYASVGTSTNTVQVLNSANQAVYTSSFGLSGSAGPYTMVLAGFSGVTRTTVLTENQGSPASGTASLRFLNQAPDAGSIDIYMLSSGQSLASAPPLLTVTGIQVTGFYAVNAGTYELVVTGAGNRSDVRLDQTGIVIGSGVIETMILSSATGGTLVNGIMLVQQGAATPYNNPQSRIRAVATLAAGATAAVTLVDSAGASTALLAGNATPAIGSYSTVAGGKATVNFKVSGVSLSQTLTLSAGQDYTLLIYGNAAAPTLSLVSDSNVLPSANSTSNVRLYNGLSGSTSPISLSVDFVPIASNVAPGAAALGTVLNTPLTSTTIAVTGAASYSASNVTVNTGAVYSVFMMGSASNPIGQLYRDR
jgi:hypothetical protein